MSAELQELVKSLKQSIDELREKFNPHHDSHGRFASGGGSGSFDQGKWEGMPVPDRRDAWAKLPVRQRDEMANASKSVPARIKEHLKGVGKRPDTGDLEKDIGSRVSQFSDRITQESASMISDTVRGYNDILDMIGVSQADRRALAMEAADHLCAQEMEACTRQLGDHGVHHIAGNIRTTMDVLTARPTGETPMDVATAFTAHIFHDSGYLTPPSGMFLDEGHPRWSGDHYEANLKPMVTKALGDRVANEVGMIIRTHDSSHIDWTNEPVASACRIGDNLALFQRDKLPPLFRHVPENVGVLERLASKEIGIDAARAEMRGNIGKARGVPPKVQKLLMRAADEVSPVTPKMTLGVLGGRLGRVEWKRDHPLIHLQQDAEMTRLHKLGDFGQRQFGKFAESYGHDSAQFTKDLSFACRDSKSGRLLLETVME
jgi:hypothetical protein